MCREWLLVAAARSAFFHKVISYKAKQVRHSGYGWVLERPLAAGRPPSSLQGGIHGVSLQHLPMTR